MRGHDILRTNEIFLNENENKNENHFAEWKSHCFMQIPFIFPSLFVIVLCQQLAHGESNGFNVNIFIRQSCMQYDKLC